MIVTIVGAGRLAEGVAVRALAGGHRLRVVDSDEIMLEMLVLNWLGLLKGGPNFLYVIMPVNLQ